MLDILSVRILVIYPCGNCFWLIWLPFNMFRLFTLHVIFYFKLIAIFHEFTAVLYSDTSTFVIIIFEFPASLLSFWNNIRIEKYILIYGDLLGSQPIIRDAPWKKLSKLLIRWRELVVNTVAQVYFRRKYGQHCFCQYHYLFFCLFIIGESVIDTLPLLGLMCDSLKQEYLYRHPWIIWKPKGIIT